MVEKDSWDIVIVISKFIVAFAALLVPIIVACLGNEINKTLKNKEISVQYVGLAIDVLKGESNKDLRKWAVETLNKHSDVKFSEKVEAHLLKHPIFSQGIQGQLNPYDAFSHLYTNFGIATPSVKDFNKNLTETGISFWQKADRNKDSYVAFLYISCAGFIRPGLYEKTNSDNDVFIVGGTSGDVFFGDGSVYDPYPGIVVPFEDKIFGIKFVVDSQQGKATYLSDFKKNLYDEKNIAAIQIKDFADQELSVDFDNDNVGDQTITLDQNSYLAFFVNSLAGKNRAEESIGLLLTNVKPVGDE